MNVNHKKSCGTYVATAASQGWIDHEKNRDRNNYSAPPIRHSAKIVDAHGCSSFDTETIRYSAQVGL